MKLWEGQSIANRKYTLVKSLGRGAQGEVWEAWQRSHEGFNKPVVLKFQLLAPPQNQEQERQNQDSHRMFLNEARIAAKLHHPNIVEIYDLGQDRDLYFIAMERILGKSLRELLDQRLNIHKQPIPWAIATAIIMQICKGLAYAHTHTDENGVPLGLIHRDLKPANLLFTFEGIAKVIDFGIAKVTTQTHQTHLGTIKGTLAYLSPEQLNPSQSIDARSDLFALGILFYELCSGKKPFYQKDIPSLLFSIVSASPPPLQDLVPTIPTELCQIISKMLEKNPNHRFQSAEELRLALKEFLQSQRAIIDQDDLSAFYLSLFPRPQPLPDPSFLAPDTVMTPSPRAPQMPPAPNHLSQTAPYPPQTPSNGEKVSIFSDETHLLPRPSARTLKPQIILALSVSFALLCLVLAWYALFSTPLSHTTKTTKTKHTTRTQPVSIASPKTTQRPEPTQPPDLTPQPTRGSALTPPSPLPPQTTDALPTLPAPPRQRTKPTPYGSLRILIQPSCLLSLKGKRLGRTGPTTPVRIRLKAGRTYRFLCRDPLQGIHTTLPIYVKANSRRTFKKILQKGRFWFFSAPWASATLQTSGLPLQQQRWFSFYEGTYKVAFRKQGQTAHSRLLRVTIRPHKDTRCILNWHKRQWKCR